MPAKIPLLTLEEMCLQTVVANFAKLENVKYLPPTMIDELYERRCNLHARGRKLPATIFIHSAIRRLDTSCHCGERIQFDLPDTQILTRIGRLSERLIDLNLTNWRDILPGELVQLMTSIPQIQSLNLSNTPCDDSVLRAMGRHCQQLKRLDVSGCRGVTNYGIRWLCFNSALRSRQSTITALNVLLTRVTEHGCVMALRNMSHLRDFQNNLHGQILTHLVKLTPQEFFRAEKLEALAGKEFWCGLELQLASVFFPNLRHVAVYRLQGPLLSLTQFKGLRELSVYEFPNYSDCAMASLLENFERLTRLSLYNIDKIDVKLVGRSCPFLETLLLSGSSDWSDRSDRSDQKPCDFLPFGRLRQLSLLDFEMSKKNWEVLVGNCKDLESLVVMDCESFDDHLVADLLGLNRLASLQCLRLTECDLLTIRSLLMFLRLENPLPFIYIFNCSEFGEFEFFLLQDEAIESCLNVQIQIHVLQQDELVRYLYVPGICWTYF